jgi:hypothetical protein
VRNEEKREEKREKGKKEKRKKKKKKKIIFLHLLVRCRFLVRVVLR